MNAEPSTPLWLTIATFVVAFLSLVATLFFSIRAERRNRAARRNTAISIDPVGTLNSSSTQAIMNHIWELSNNGTVDARIWALIPVNCEFDFDSEHLPVRRVRAGQQVRLQIKPCDVSAAWVLVLSSSLGDTRRVLVQWEAPEPGEYLRTEMERQLEEPSTFRERVTMFLRTHFRIVESVGPGGAAVTLVLANKWHAAGCFTTAISLAQPQSASANVIDPSS